LQPDRETLSAPGAPKITGPLGCTSPYSSLTAQAAVFIVQPVSLTIPETVTGTIFRFGGHKNFGLIEIVITGEATLSSIRSGHSGNPSANGVVPNMPDTRPQ